MYLVDTHVLLWLVAEPDRLGPLTRQSLRASSVYVSSISVLELTIKAMIGKLVVPADLTSRLVEQGVTMLTFDSEHAQTIAAFPSLARHDPFDRALLAQTLTERLTFLTVDARLLALGLSWVEDAAR